MLQLFGQINKNVIDPTYISSIRICARKNLKRNSTIVKIFQMLMNK